MRRVRRTVISIVAVAATVILTWPSLTSHPISASAPAPAMSPSQVMGLLGSENSMGVGPGRIPASAHPPVATNARRGATCPAPYGWLTTQGPWIVEAQDPNCKVRLAGVSWFGMQSNTYALAGLNYEKYTTILDEVANMGFNSIRIPFSDELVEKSANITINHKKFLRANPELPSNLHPLQLLDDVVNYAATKNLMIILDNHFSTAVPASGTPPPQRQVRRSVRLGGPPVGIGNENQWIQDWVALANRYINNSNVIGFDLRNEPHTQWDGKWWNLQDYVENGATWGPCTKKLCGKYASKWKPSSDWVAEAEKAGNAILAVNPKLLMFVEGTQLYPHPHSKTGVYSYWWGAILRGAQVDPVVFNVPNQLVYSPHVWGPWKCCDPDGEFTGMSYNSIAQNYYDNWAFVLSNKNPAIQAPVWIGEFNTCNAAMKGEKGTGIKWIKPAKACVYSTKSGSEGQWFHILIQYLQNNPEIGWSYYPLNGTTELDGQANNSILGCPRGSGPPKCNPWDQPRLPAIVQALQTIEGQPN